MTLTGKGMESSRVRETVGSEEKSREVTVSQAVEGGWSEGSGCRVAAGDQNWIPKVPFCVTWVTWIPCPVTSSNRSSASFTLSSACGERCVRVAKWR